MIQLNKDEHDDDIDKEIDVVAVRTKFMNSTNEVEFEDSLDNIVDNIEATR